ncbi:MAG: DUF2975 domain-containing protein [Christensenellales bacterium]
MSRSEWNIPIILKRMIECLLIPGVLLIIALPIAWIFGPRAIRDFFAGHTNDQWITYIFLQISAVLCWLILFFLRRLLTIVIKSSPFIYCNVLYLKYISYLCAFAALVLFVKTFLDFSVLTPVVAVLAVLSSLFCQTLAAVFDKAIRLKDENDLTI